MESHEPDSYPGESEEDYLARKRKEVEITGGLIANLFILALHCIRIIVIYGGFLYAGFFLTKKFLGTETDKAAILAYTLGFTYLILCVVYFLKGTIIGLRAKNRKLWILPWIICILATCIFPAFLVTASVATMFNSVNWDQTWFKIIRWVSFSVTVLIVYNIYAFKTPFAPRFFFWAYKWGVKLTS